MTEKIESTSFSDALLTDLRALIDTARQQVAQTANATLTMLYWHVGQRIHKEVLNEQRAEYGEEILPTLSTKLVWEYGQGFGVRNLARMIRFSEEKFQPAHKGQMELYLRWLNQYDRAAGEEPPIGLILCAAKDAEQVKLLDMNAANIRVAEYVAHIPDAEVLQTQLHRAVTLARERAAQTLSLS